MIIPININIVATIIERSCGYTAIRIPEITNRIPPNIVTPPLNIFIKPFQASDLLKVENFGDLSGPVGFHPFMIEKPLL